MKSSLVRRREAVLVSLEDNERTLQQAWASLKADLIRKTDIPQRIEEEPLRWLAGGFCLGLLVGLWRD